MNTLTAEGLKDLVKNAKLRTVCSFKGIELVCSTCGGLLVAEPLVIVPAEGWSWTGNFLRLVSMWEECNGDLSDIRCRRCRGD